jgi:hypothetical protein
MKGCVGLSVLGKDPEGHGLVGLAASVSRSGLEGERFEK